MGGVKRQSQLQLYFGFILHRIGLQTLYWKDFSADSANPTQ